MSIRNAKRKGSRNELRSLALLEAEGYSVTKSGGSLGCWDLIGIRKQDCVGCQVKTRDWPSREEMEVLRSFEAPDNFRKLVHRWLDGKKIPDQKEL